MTGVDPDLARLQIVVPRTDVGAQLFESRIRVRVFAGKDVPDSAPALQPDIPDPTVLLRRGYGVRRDVASIVVIGNLDGQSAINKQHIAAVYKRHSEGLSQQQRPEPGAVDEQIPTEAPGATGFNILDIPALGLHHPGHIIHDVTYAEVLHAMLTNEGREAPGIQVIGVIGDARIFGRGNQFGAEPQLTHRLLETHGVREGGRILMLFGISVPERRQVEAREAFGQHQRVIVEIGSLAGGPPGKFRALLERGVALSEEFRLRHTHLLQSGTHRRPGPFAHTDDANCLAFHQGDQEAAPVAGGNDSGREPPGRTPANDTDRSYRAHHGPDSTRSIRTSRVRRS